MWVMRMVRAPVESWAAVEFRGVRARGVVDARDTTCWVKRSSNTWVGLYSRRTRVGEKAVKRYPDRVTG